MGQTVRPMWKGTKEAASARCIDMSVVRLEMG